MLIRLHKSITVLSISIMLSQNINTLSANNINNSQLSQNLGQISNVVNQLNNLTGQLNNLTSSYTFSIFGLQISLKCINPIPKIPRAYDICKNYLANNTMFDYSGSSSSFGFDLGICEVDANSGVSTRTLANEYDKLLERICRQYAVSNRGYNTGNPQDSVNHTQITEVEYSPVTTEIVTLPEYSAISYSSKAVESNPDNIIFPSGITQKELYEGSDGKGYYAYKAKTSPNSSTALAYKANDKKTLIVKDMAIKATGYDNENLIALPKNKNQVMIATASKAQLRYVDPMINWSEFMDYVEGNLTSSFLALTPNGATADEMYADIKQKEYDKWKEFVESDKIQDIYKKQEDMVKSIFTDIMMLQTNSKDYIFDPSQAKLKTLPIEYRTGFKYSALIQMTKETMLKGIMGQIIKYKRELLDLSLKKAYICATPFRANIAKKELEEVLQNVDSLIP